MRRRARWVQLLAGIYQGKWLSDYSRRVLLDAMEETTTGKRRMRSALPLSANLAHKTGTLARTASDIGIFHTPDGRAIAAAIYVTGQSPSMAIENGSRGQKLEARTIATRGSRRSPRRSIRASVDRSTKVATGPMRNMAANKRFRLPA